MKASKYRKNMKRLRHRLRVLKLARKFKLFDTMGKYSLESIYVFCTQYLALAVHFVYQYDQAFGHISFAIGQIDNCSVRQSCLQALQREFEQ